MDFLNYVKNGTLPPFSLHINNFEVNKTSCQNQNEEKHDSAVACLYMALNVARIDHEVSRRQIY